MVAGAALDRQPDHLLDARVALIEVEGDDVGVAVDAERELGEVVGADREAVEQFGEVSIRMTLFGISHIT